MRAYQVLPMMLLMMLSSYSYAQKKPFLVGLDLGYAFNQGLEVETSSPPIKEHISNFDKGSGFAYGLHFGYVIGESHRVKLGYLAFDSTFKWSGPGTFEDAKVKNTYFHIDYDYLFHINSTMDITLGANVGYMNNTIEEDDLKLDSAAYGFQLGYQYHLDQVVFFSEIRYVIFDGYDEIRDTPALPNEYAKYKLPSFMLFSLGAAYKF